MITSQFANFGRLEIEGQVDLSAAGAVVATRGDGASTVKNDTGLYDVTIRNPWGHVLNEVLFSVAGLQDAAVGTTKDVGVKSITQNTDGTFKITLRTVDAAGADVDEAASTLTVSYSVVLRVCRMTNPF